MSDIMNVTERVIAFQERIAKLESELAEEKFMRGIAETGMREAQDKIDELGEALEISQAAATEEAAHADEVQAGWQKAKKRIAELKAERDELRKSLEKQKQTQHQDYQRVLGELKCTQNERYIMQVQRDELREALRDYGDHEPGCYQRNAPNEIRGCTCHWNEIREVELGHD